MTTVQGAWPGFKSNSAFYYLCDFLVIVGLSLSICKVEHAAIQKPIPSGGAAL